MNNKEFGRQLFHIVIGLVLIAMLAYIGRNKTMAITFMVIVIGSVLINRKAIGKKLWIFDDVYEKFEREGSRVPGWGPAWYLVGTLIAMVFLKDINQIAAIIFVLAIGDGFSTLIGIKSKTALPYNSKKTIAGTMAFFISSLPAYIFIKETVIPVALLATIVESLPLDIEDNITIPLSLVLLFYAMGAI